jgi:Carboxypeptidase regulatory-like domain
MPSTYTLKGKVTDAALGTKVPNVTVKIVGADAPANFGKTAVTDSSGKYKITHVEPGRILIEASLSYQPNEKSLTISANTTIDFALSK